MISENLDNFNSVSAFTMTVEEVAKALGVSKPTAYKLTRSRGFPSFRIGRKVIVSKEGFRSWFEAQCGKEAS